MRSPDAERREWIRVEAVLDEALDAPAPDRPALVAARCGDDEALRVRVMRLLAACDEAEGHFETPPRVAPELRDQLAPGDRAGAYEVESLLGRGGMGSVYLARRADGVFDRSVALKVVKRGMDTVEILDRFRQERSILARLQHPSIATLLDGGVTEGGLPYFAMEVVRGDPIDVWCAARRLDVDARLRLFIEVCDAVAYAHRSLVVHRDLKPSNILVLPDGQPKLLDFGIAKLLEDGPAGEVTSVLGRRATPDYAAPEQVQGEPTTTATDVYSLGVILYELLAGRRPHRSTGSAAQVVRSVVEGSVAPPSRVAQGPVAARLRGDLDAIVLKAMRTEPERRYSSVQALAQDLERVLEGRPVEARPDSVGYRFGKFVRRHRVPVGFGVAAILALLAGTVSTSVMAYVADREREQREVEAERARAARDFVVELFAGLDPDRLDGRSTFTRDELIELGIRNLDDLEGQPSLRAGILNTLGQLAFNLGDRERAEDFFLRSHGLLADEAETPDLAVSMLGLGEILRTRLRFEEAEVWLRRAVEVNRRLLPAGDPRIAESRAALAFALYNRGPDHYPQAEAIYEELSAADPPLPLPIRARIAEGFADLRYGQERYAEAEQLYRRAVEERAEVAGRRDSGVARTLWGLGHALMAQGEAARAAEVYGESLDILTRTYGSEHADVAWAHYNLGSAFTATGAAGDAAASFAEAARLMEALYPPGYLYAAFAWLRLGRVQETLDRFDAAGESYRSALAVYEAILEEGGSVGDERLASVHDDLARVLGALGRSDSAAVHEGRADEIRTGGVSAGAAGFRR